MLIRTATLFITFFQQHFQNKRKISWRNIWKGPRCLNLCYKTPGGYIFDLSLQISLVNIEEGRRAGGQKGQGGGGANHSMEISYTFDGNPIVSFRFGGNLWKTLF